MASMQEYLKRYTSDGDKKKKKKKSKSKPVQGSSLTIVDADPVWQKEIKDESSQSESEKEDAPLVIEDVEFKRLKRLEELRTRPYLGTAADGSGWVSVNDSQIQGLQGEDMVLEVSITEEDMDAGMRSPHQEKDLSPPRKGRRYSPQIVSPQLESSPRGSSPQIQDLSLPRRRPQRGHGDSFETIAGEEDLSPPRREPDLAKKLKAMDRSPSKRACRILDNKDSTNKRDGDLSPPRRCPKRVRHDSPESISLQEGHVLNEFPDRRIQNNVFKENKGAEKIRDGDLSPPRRHLTRVLHDTPGSPSLQTSNVRDDTSTRGVHTHVYMNEMLPTNNRHGDLSPPRKQSRKANHDSPEAILQNVRSPDNSSQGRHKIYASKDSTHFSPTRHIDDFSAGELPSTVNRDKHGLHSGTDIAKEAIAKKKTDFRRMKELDITLSGRNASTVYRDKHGRRLEGVDALLKLQQAEEPKKDTPLEWGKGLVQKREAEAQQAEIEAEKAKPFARTIQDLDAMLREQVRWGDPMAHLVKKKTEPALFDLGASEKMKESGFIIPQEIPSHSWLKRGIAPPPNRYGIKPGRHWDGVDRSTGYERDMYKRQNERKAEQEEAYLWSVADM